MRNPIYNIQLLSKLLLEPTENLNQDDAGEYLGLIHTTAENTFSLLDNLLEWTKSQTGQLVYRPHKVNLAQVIKDIVISSDSIAQIKDIDLSSITVPNMEIYTDDKILKTILRNLVSNAIKFTGEGGKVTIFTIMAEDWVEIIVSDNGIGISENNQEHLFGSMSSLSSTNTGFGLVICKEFVEKLGGRIWVESVPGKGSDFKFTLPFKLS
ncbi:HAMP domain-containing histidine kinase [Niabella ginsengisoli]|uniref:histidine kinase n=1 Tax=Niabella ginsengisoli TaxID=522298 RepID=A0ABS9SG62_9BACT|nr:HAMP domain-containing histidine kinase [Niabella ginsengisoli]